MKHSVIIPAYNAVAYIEQSIGSALSQLGADDEIIVVDDGSVDDTIEVVKKLRDARIKLLCQPSNLGIAAARNRALSVVSGDYIHFLDHDDLWSSDRILTLASLIQAQQPDIISGWVEHFYCDSLVDSQKAKYLLPVPQVAALPGSVVMRLALIQQIGKFDPSLSSGEFIDFLSRAMALKPRWVKTDKIIFLRRIHGFNHTLTDSHTDTSYLEVIRRHLARVRLSGRRVSRHQEE